MFEIKIMRIVLSLILLYLNSIDANQTELWESALNELRNEFEYKLGLNIKIHNNHDKKVDDLKNLFSSKASFDFCSTNLKFSIKLHLN
jgi:hypothetical protein